MTQEYEVELGQGNQFEGETAKAAEEFGLKKDQYRLTNYGLARKFQEILIDIAKENGTDLTEKKLQNEFNSKKGDLFSSWLAGTPNRYQVIFPINLRDTYIPDEINLIESKAMQVDYEVWKEDYFSVAVSADNSNFGSFVEEVPNDFTDNIYAERDWTYLSVEIEARDELFALWHVYEMVEMRIAEINYFDTLWEAGPRVPAGVDRAPNEKWSKLMVPPFYLVFRDSEFEIFGGIDYDYRRLAGPFHFYHSEIKSIDDIPTFDYRKDANTYDGQISSGLLAFQDGITERKIRQSFFSFWRGIEILSGTNNFGEMVDRGRFSLIFHRGDENLRPELEKAMKELVDMRHSLVHEGLKTEITSNHRNGAKILLDALLKLYIEKHAQWDIEETYSFLKHGSEYKEKLQFITSLLSNLGKGEE